MLLGGSCPWFPVPWKSRMLPKGPALPGQPPSQHGASPDLREQQEGAWSCFSHTLGSKWDVHPGLLPLALGSAAQRDHGRDLCSFPPPPLLPGLSASWVTLDLSLLLPVPACTEQPGPGCKISPLCVCQGG